MRFSTAGIALCAIQAVASSAIEPRALTCSPGNKVANYNDLTALPIDDGNTGLTSAQLNPYQDLNYTRFSVISGATSGDNLIFYTLSRISAGTLSAVETALNNILGSLGLGIGIPPVLEAPRIVGSRSPTTQYRLQSFQFGCSIRAGAAATVIPIPCTVTVRPVETLRLGQSYNCSYTETPSSGIGGGLALKTCVPTGLLAGQGFTFQTTPDILNTSSLGSLKPLVDTALELLVVSVFDNFTYREYCL
ncbi:hypothetical protein G7054_g3536 [Neopestalotiopsis clavispora]|nr:hypothetical protein G7054_g3536 [Neopestalotiopsis clavispora]